MKNKVYKCPICGLHYHDEKTAEACQAFCEDNKACSLEIIKKSVENETSQS